LKRKPVVGNGQNSAAVLAALLSGPKSNEQIKEATGLDIQVIRLCTHRMHQHSKVIEVVGTVPGVTRPERVYKLKEGVQFATTMRHFTKPKYIAPERVNTNLDGIFHAIVKSRV
jgi:hypothetical protein